LEEESLQPKKESPSTQINRRSNIEEVNQEGEDLTKEVEVEEEVEKLSLDATNVTN
jgi:hypothetical protein